MKGLNYKSSECLDVWMKSYIEKYKYITGLMTRKASYIMGCGQ